MIINVTLVRVKDTGEPVAVFEQENDIILLGKMVDEVIDPSVCQYADHLIDIDIGILFHSSCHNFFEDELAAEDCIRSGVMDDIMSKQLKEVFMDDLLDIEWCDFPCINYLGSSDMDNLFINRIDRVF